MYVGSGACGFMISALFSASLLSNGASAAIYGMVGVETVSWITFLYQIGKTSVITDVGVLFLCV